MQGQKCPKECSEKSFWPPCSECARTAPRSALGHSKGPKIPKQHSLEHMFQDVGERGLSLRGVVAAFMTLLAALAVLERRCTLPSLCLSYKYKRKRQL